MYLHTKFYEAHTLSSMTHCMAQKLFEPDGRKRLSFIKVGMNVHWYLVYNSINIGLLQSQT